MEDSDPTTYDLRPDLDSLQPPLRLDRRGFVKTSLGAGFAAAVLPVQAQTMITTDTQGLTAGEVRIPVAGGEMVGVPRAAGRQDRACRSCWWCQEIFGVHEHIKDVCRRLAKLGYLAIAPELFARQGDASKMSDVQSLIRTSLPRRPMRRSWPTSMRPPRGLRRMAAAASWVSPGSAGVAGSSGCTPHTIRTLAAGVAWYGTVARGYFPGDKGAIDRAASHQGADAGSVRRCRRRHPERHSWKRCGSR